MPSCKLPKTNQRFIYSPVTNSFIIKTLIWKKAIDDAAKINVMQGTGLQHFLRSKLSESVVVYRSNFQRKPDLTLRYPNDPLLCRKMNLRT